MRLIDGDALIKRLDYCVSQGLGSKIASMFGHMVDEAPTVDAVPVVVKINTIMTRDDFRCASKEIKHDNPNIIVLPYYCDLLYPALIRCKDCKHYDAQVQQCTYEADWFGIEPNGFCSRAERKEE